jgi:hypothetical protein
VVTISWPFGLYGHGMHDFILRELEIGFRAASFEEGERVDRFPPAILKLIYERDQTAGLIR